MLLTIAIPTYERPELLRKCLLSIFEQIDESQVSVVVIDDSMSDVNETVLNWAKNECKTFRSIKNKVNLGIDLNIEKCLNLDESEYLLVLGEDDIIMPDAITNILSILHKNRVDVIFTSYVYMDNALNKIIREPFRHLDKNMSNENFIKNYFWAIGFIGSIVISTAVIRKSDMRFLGTYFNHVGRIAMGLTSSSVIYHSPEPLVGNRSEDISSTTWSSSFYDVLFGFETLMDILSNEAPLGGLFKDAKNSFKHNMKHHSIFRVIEMRTVGIYNEKVYEKYFLSDCNSFFVRLMYKQVSRIPCGLLQPYRSIFNIARRLKRYFLY